MESGEKRYLKPNGSGTYLVQVQFAGGGATEITVDHGSEESVCPWEWGQQFGTGSIQNVLSLRNASGTCSRDVEVFATF
eukprot:11119877-Karenia_brevis.AAC.1